MKKILLTFLMVATMLYLYAGNDTAKTDTERLTALEKWKTEANKRITSLEKKLIVSGNKTVIAGSKDKSTKIFKVKITNKKSGKVNQFQKGLFWNLSLTAVGLKKDSRAIKGQLEFYDLFGEYKFGINYTINRPLKKDAEYTQSGTGFKLNEFLPKHTWMRNTALKDMKILFRVKQIIYSDGSTEKFEK